MLLLTKSAGRAASIGMGALLTVVAMTASAQAQGRRAECAEYAREAVGQYEQSERLACYFDGPRWSDAREAHFAWCLISPRAAADENRIRRRMLQECADRRADRGGGGRGREGKRADCDTYAKIAAVQAEANEKFGCGYRGQEWSRGDRGHYQWCMTNRRDFMIDQLRYRADELQKCFNKLGDYDGENRDRSCRASSLC